MKVASGEKGKKKSKGQKREDILEEGKTLAV